MAYTRIPTTTDVNVPSTIHNVPSPTFVPSTGVTNIPTSSGTADNVVADGIPVLADGDTVVAT